MNKILPFFILFSTTAYGQNRFDSGIYQELKLAYDTTTNQVTGFYENGTGIDEGTGKPRFSCAFYFEGKLLKTKATIISYYPFDSVSIAGELVANNNEIALYLDAEHGGCWNVQHFADKPVKFSIDKKYKWIQIRYSISSKTFFYRNKAESSKLNTYIVKGDIVYIKKVEGSWVYCDYVREKITTGWVKIADLNKLKSE